LEPRSHEKIRKKTHARRSKNADGEFLMNNVFRLILPIRAGAIILALSAMPWLKVFAAVHDVDNGDEKIVWR
jgi:hypothetical protein